jgi:hypothetical protein
MTFQTNIKRPQILGTPESYTRQELLRARQCAREALAEIERALACTSEGILAHVQIHAEVLQEPLAFTDRFVRGAIEAANTVERDTALRMAMGVDEPQVMTERVWVSL